MKRKKWIGLGPPFALALLIAASHPLKGMEIPLNYVAVSDEIEGFMPIWGYSMVEKAREKPPGEWTWPKIKSEAPVFLTLTLGDHDYTALLDQSDPKFIQYDRLTIDLNRNRDLTDDKVFEAETRSDRGIPEDYPYMVVMFPTMKIEVEQGGKVLPYEFAGVAQAYLNDQKKPVTDDVNWENFWFYTRPQCFYKGQGKIDDLDVQFWISDKNVNGRFTDQAAVAVAEDKIGDQTLPITGDDLFITIGKDTEPQYNDGIGLGNLLLLKDSLYTLEVDIGAKKLIIEPYDGPKASLELSSKPSRIQLASKDGKNVILAIQPSGAIPVPPDAYRFFKYQLNGKGTAGDEWSLTALATGLSGYTTAGSEDSPGQVKLAEPFTPKVVIPPYAMEQIEILKKADPDQKPPLRLAFTIVGTAGEEVTALQRISGEKSDIPLSQTNPTRPKEPSFRIVKGDGEVVHSGQFEYG
jgi:hypothetical protein